jgi:hypothetical protein
MFKGDRTRQFWRGVQVNGSGGCVCLRGHACAVCPCNRKKHLTRIGGDASPGNEKLPLFQGEFGMGMAEKKQSRIIAR